MPYNIYFLIFEALIILLFGFTIRHALKKGPANVFQLLAGVLFGIFLELATIQQLHAYRYGNFLLMVYNVPLVIGISWGIILYCIRLTSDKSNIPWMIRPLLDGLLALNIDLAMDAVAIRLGMWDWGKGWGFEYFGVPFANFWAWFWVAFSFSAGIRFLTHWLVKLPESGQSCSRSAWKTDLAIALGGLLAGLAGVLGTNALIVYVVPEKYRPWVIAATLLGALVLALYHRPKFTGSHHDPITFWIPFAFHVYFLAAGIVSRVIFQPMVLLYMSFAMLALSCYWHKSYLGRRGRRIDYRSGGILGD